MRGIKAFDRDLCCRGMHYEVGGTYRLDGEPVPCRWGFHFCPTVRAAASYYDLDSRFCEVEATGRIVVQGDKSVTDELRIIRELTREEVCRAYYLDGHGYGHGDGYGYGYGYGDGYGNGDGRGYGYGYGYGHGYGHGYGYGDGRGNGHGYGHGDGYGYGYGYGDGYGNGDGRGYGYGYGYGYGHGYGHGYGYGYGKSIKEVIYA